MKTTLLSTFRSGIALWCIWTLLVLPMGVPVALAQSTLAASKPRVAILEFEGVGMTPAETAAVTDQLRSDMVRLKIYTVLDRKQTQRVLDEMALQQSGITDPDQAVKIGKILGVEYIVTGRVTALSGAYQVNAQMMRVETAEIERSENILYQGHILGLLSENMSTLAARLADVEGAGAAPPVRTAKAQEEDTGWSWWTWTLIGLAVLGLAAAASGGAEETTTGGATCPTASCGSLPIAW